MFVSGMKGFITRFDPGHCNDGLFLLVDEDVFGLEVAMQHKVGVYVLDTTDDLQHDALHAERSFLGVLEKRVSRDRTLATVQTPSGCAP